MSQLLIQHYLNQLHDLRQASGTQRESVVREAFKDLLKGWARAHDLIFVPEYEIATPAGERRYVDGALLHALRIPFGYWEAKDERDDLDAEIAFKSQRGYPRDNILFEDSSRAVLIQNRVEVMRCAVDDVAQLEKLLKQFFAYERAEITEFRQAVAQFKADLPAVLAALRAMIEKAHADHPAFRAAAQAFLDQARAAINPHLGAADVREMLIQHVLTEELFVAVFPGTSFHRDNHIARELYALEGVFFTGNTKFQTLKGLAPYYAAIRAAAARIDTHHEKQTFLKVLYENFYRVYNVKAADRLGVVYTPNEIVRFMINSADWLCETHFGRNLIDRDVEILDPATGTGTFICELLEHFRGQPTKLKAKYREELHANEIAILPYYVANLNIEATYAAITGEYQEFPNLCFVDTLDNVGPHTAARGTTGDLFGAITEENFARIKRQNSRTISVIIGNPPYNANQLNENDNNKNRDYQEVDRRIKETYIAASTAQKTKLYDMYARFFRWASDRLAENGIIAFVSNSSFIDSRTFDGFRKVLAQEFNEIWIIDLKGNARTSGERRRQEGGNVFDNQIRVGVAVYFCVKKQGARGCRIFYEAVRDYAKADEKREFLQATPIWHRTFQEIRPDPRHNWINVPWNDFDRLIPLASKETKAAKKAAQEKAIFKLFSMGVKTNRDSWVCDFSETRLEEKVAYLINQYQSERQRLGDRLSHETVADQIKYEIKWTRKLKNLLVKGIDLNFKRQNIIASLYRPYVVLKIYFAPELNEDWYQLRHIPFGENNPLILLPGFPNLKPFHVLATTMLFHHDTLEKTSGVGRWRIDPKSGQPVENITDWALDQFKKHYKPGRAKAKRPMTKEAIFHYVYGVLHDPIYREKYALNLKRVFPRIPFYPDFWRWADWGRELMDLHIGYATVEPYPLQRFDLPDTGYPPKALLKADPGNSRIVLDAQTTLLGVPPEVWQYRLGNRSALEWILDQYKESKPKDSTLRARFDVYRFSAYKEQVIDLLKRAAAVSLRTQEIINAMRGVHQAASASRH